MKKFLYNITWIFFEIKIICFQYVTDVRQLQKRIQESEEAVQFINKEEELFKWEVTKYPELDKLKVNIEPYQKFFNLVLKWQRTEKR